MSEATKLYLNTWKAYNEGSIGYGWMTPEQARDFIEENPERDGGEWFVADLDNYLNIKFRNLEYKNVLDIIETIETLENMAESERKQIVALMEYLVIEDVQEAIDEIDNYIIYEDIEAYHDSCDELIEEELQKDSIITRYFDYEAYHRDCDFDAYEAENGVVILR